MAIKLKLTVDATGSVSAEGFNSVREAERAIREALINAIGQFGNATNVRVSLELER